VFLQRQIVTVPFAQGLDTKTDPFQLGPGKLQQLVNGVFTTAKKIRKRYGTTAKSASIFGGGSIAAADTLRSFKDELLIGSSGSLYSWSTLEAAWISKGAMVRVDVARTPAIRDSSGATKPVSAVHSSGIECVASQRSDASGNAYVSVRLIDVLSGAAIAEQNVASALASLQIQVTATDTDFLVFSGGTGSVQYSRISLAGAIVSNVVVSADFGANGALDVISTGTGASQKVYIAHTTAAATDVKAYYFDNAWTLSAATTVGLAASMAGYTIGALALMVDTGGAVLLATSAGNAAALSKCYLSVLTSTVGVTTAAIVIAAAFATNGTSQAITLGLDSAGTPRAWFGAALAAVGGIQRNWIQTCSMAGYAAGALSVLSRNSAIVGHAFRQGTTPYIVIQTVNGGSPFLTIHGETGAVIARSAADDGQTSQHKIPARPGFASGSWRFPVLVTAYLFAAGGRVAGIAGIDVLTLTFVTTPALTAELGNSIHISSGLIKHYDGAGVVELGFHHAPVASATFTPGAGSLVAGTYGYRAVYEWMDSTGALHQSAPSTLQTIVPAVGGTATINVATLGKTAKTGWANFVQIALYRTLTTGTVLYRLKSAPNSLTADYVTFTDDGLVDPVLPGNALLYTTGGVLENTPPPPFSAMTVYRNRLVGINAEKPTQLWYSKQVIPGQPVEFSDFLVLNLDPVGGDCTALAALDDKLIIFKPGVAYYVTGSGPDTTGGQNDLSVPILINTNSGCVEPRSVITAADGVMYQSAKGVFILDRSLQDSYIGYGVESSNALGVRGVVQVPSTNEVRFTMSDGSVLVFDFLYKQWSVFTGLSAVDTAVWGGSVHTVKSTGVVSYEDPTVFTDNGTAIVLRLKTGWLGAGDLQSFLRIYKMFILGSWKSSHALQVLVNYDYLDFIGLGTLSVIDASLNPYPSQFQHRINLARQKCEAIQITIFDSSITGESLDLSALSFEVGVKGSPMKMPAARSL
jgi:hypothetical protein